MLGIFFCGIGRVLRLFVLFVVWEVEEVSIRYTKVVIRSHHLSKSNNSKHLQKGFLVLLNTLLTTSLHLSISLSLFSTASTDHNLIAYVSGRNTPSVPFPSITAFLSVPILPPLLPFITHMRTIHLQYRLTASSFYQSPSLPQRLTSFRIQ
jgi:hypothetical protein